MTANTEYGSVRVQHSRDIVEYQPQAIVSRTVIDTAVGTITFFAFSPGQGLSEHTVPFAAFVQVLDGQARITVSGVEHELTAGQIIVMPAHQPHRVFAEHAFKMMLVMIRAEQK